MNKVILCGRLTHDPEVKYTQAGKAVCRFRLAVERYNAESDFINCVVFNKQAENFGKYCTKGKQIIVEGNIKTGSYEKDGRRVYTTDIWADRIEYISGGGSNTEASQPKREAPPVQEMFKYDDGDIPF